MKDSQGQTALLPWHSTKDEVLKWKCCKKKDAGFTAFYTLKVDQGQEVSP